MGVYDILWIDGEEVEFDPFMRITVTKSEFENDTFSDEDAAEPTTITSASNFVQTTRPTSSGAHPEPSIPA